MDARKEIKKNKKSQLIDCYQLILVSKKIIPIVVQIKTSNNFLHKFYYESIAKNIVDFFVASGDFFFAATCLLAVTI